MLVEVNSSIGYETVKETFQQQNSGYESLPEPDSLTPGYERIREPNPGYEKIKYTTTKEDESDPNYEELKLQIDENEPFHCYATINKKSCDSNNATSSIDAEERVGEPDYASLRRANPTQYDGLVADNDPFYERIRGRHSSVNLGTTNEENEDELNNNHSPTNSCNSSSPSSFKNDETNKPHSVSVPNVNDLYSKVNKNVKR